MTISLEQQARDLLERMSSATQWHDPQRLTASDVVELANVMRDLSRCRALLRCFADDFDCDSDAHRYRTTCRKCEATRLLRDPQP